MSKELFTKELLEDFKKRKMTLTEISMELYGHKENYRNIRRAYKRHQIEPYRLPKLKPSKEELEKMIFELGMSPREIALALGYGADGWSNIYSYCREYGISDFSFSPNAAVARRAVDDTIGPIIHGTLLGDGSINYKGILRISHGERQLEYLRWMHEKLGWLAKPTIKKRESAMVGPYSKLPTYSIETHAHPYLRTLRQDAYATGKKSAGPILNSPFFNEQALAIWYMDDGSLNKATGVVTLATNGFSHDDVHTLRETLYERFAIESVDEPRKNNTLAIRVNKTKTQHFFDVLTRNTEIPESMKYKFPSQ